jgi:hypothetical protein
MTIVENIKKARPKLSENSIKTYLNALKTIKRCLGQDQVLDDTNFLKDFKEVKNCIEENWEKLTSQKSKITAILVALSSDNKVDEELLNKYKKYVDGIAKEYNKWLEKQEKSDAQKKNWVSYAEIITVSNDMLKKYNNLRKIKIELLSNDQFRSIQNYVMLRTQLQYPIRNDFANMKVVTPKEYSKIPENIKSKNNYLENISRQTKIFHINNYKTVKRLGAKSYNIPKDINTILNQWLKINKSDWLFVKPSNRKVALNESDITKQFYQLFKPYFPDKNISTSLLRHIIISHEKENDPTIKEIEEKKKKIEDKYLHSDSLNILYAKRDKQDKKDNS